MRVVGQGTVVRRWPNAVAVVALAMAVAVGVLRTGRDRERPPPVGGTAAEAVGVVDAFQRALTTRDYPAICDRLFTVRARAAAGGDDCQFVLAQEAGRLRAPTVEIRSVVLSRTGSAEVGVVAGTAGRRAAPDVIHLRRERGHFRIAAAGDAPRRPARHHRH
jgi:hypothetical protein